MIRVFVGIKVGHIRFNDRTRVIIGSHHKLWDTVVRMFGTSLYTMFKLFHLMLHYCNPRRISVLVNKSNGLAKQPLHMTVMSCRVLYQEHLRVTPYPALLTKTAFISYTIFKNVLILVIKSKCFKHKTTTFFFSYFYE